MTTLNTKSQLLPVNVASDLLSVDTFAALAALSTELNKAYATRQIFRTETEARVSVLDKIHYPTPASKYWQAVREQTVMLEQLATLSYEYRKNEVAIKRLEHKIANLGDTVEESFDREEAQIALEEKLFSRVTMKTVAEDRAREIQMWSMIKTEQDDGSFDTENVNTHQLISYATQFAMMASTVNPAQMGSGEVINLIGQLQTTLDRCRELNVLDKVIAGLPIAVSQQLQLTHPPKAGMI
jgi:hypothetical protein